MKKKNEMANIIEEYQKKGLSKKEIYGIISKCHLNCINEILVA